MNPFSDEMLRTGWAATWKRFRNSLATTGVLLLLPGLMATFSGCATTPMTDPAVTGPFHKVGNYYRDDQKLPNQVRRIAMLPLGCSQRDLNAKSGRDVLDDILYGELSRARLFEVVRVSSEELERWTGKPIWSQDEELPADFLLKLKEQTACEAILFSQLSFYRAYPPLAIGWRMLLVKAADGQPLWSLDEVFDAGEPRVVNSARHFALENDRANAELARQAGTRQGSAWPTYVPGWEWLNSPRQFGKYAASAAVETLSLR